MNLDKKNLKEISGDASFRIFYRKKNKSNSSIIVFAKKEKKKNLLIYDAINKLLLKNNILAPQIYYQNYDNNYLEFEDFGDNTLSKFLKSRTRKINVYKSVILLLNKIQKIKKKKIKNFNNQVYKIPLYSDKMLFDEVNLFFKWYSKKNIKKKNIKLVNDKIKKEVIKLISKIRLSNDTFVHRDFHVANLMKTKNGIGVIDSQDAVFGNKAYDLASLIDDVRFKSSNIFKELIYKEFIKFNKDLDKNNFRHDFEILSVLRNLKIIGIFTRLAVRDNKKKYLKYIPYAWKLIELRMNNNIIFDNLKKYLDIHFTKNMRLKNEN